MKTFFYLFFMLSAGTTMSTHLSGGYISYKVSSGTRVEITVNLLTDATGVTPGSGMLDLGDGNTVESLSNPTVVPLAFDVNLVSFSINHSYSTPGLYLISYAEDNYNENVNNLSESVHTPFYISTRLLIDPSIEENHSPLMKLFQAQRGASGKVQRINPAPHDLDGDSLSFSLIVPGGDRQSSLTNYTAPNNESFYNEQSGTGVEPPRYIINSSTGEILWDASDVVGEFVFAYKIVQWRKFQDDWKDVGLTEVIMMNIVLEEHEELSTIAPEIQCFGDTQDVSGQFSLTASGNQQAVARVFTNLPAGTINGVAFTENVLKIDYSEATTLNLSLPEGLELEPFRVYRVIVNIEGNHLIQSSSWAFALECSELPGYILDVRSDSNVKPEFTIFPNPTYKHIINLQFPDNKEKLREIKIMNIRGRILYHQQGYFSGKLLSLDLPALKEGVYIVKVDDQVQKFIVRR